MRRLFWVALGASTGVLLSRAVRREVEHAKENLKPGTVLARLADDLTAFLDDVRDAMAERETELRAGLGLDGAAQPGDPR
ncbi:MAG TPA: hypothetical protein VF288_04685 [Mycobacteriales bacterium]